MARAVGALTILAVVIFGWHLYGVAATRGQAEELRGKHAAGKGAQPVSVNPLTNVVTVPMLGAAYKDAGGNPLEALGAAIGSMLGGALAKALEPSIERELNLQARESYDLYAMLLPYRVRVITADSTRSTESN